MHVDRGSVSAWIICNGKIKPSGAGRFRVATNRDDIFADLFEERNMGIMSVVLAESTDPCLNGDSRIVSKARCSLPGPLLIHYPYRQ